jgi:SAM-dependent methyltransferase
LDPDSADVTTAHREVVRRKPMVRRLFERFYRECRQADERWFGDCPGLRIEIGSGSSFLKELYPDVLSSDIKALPFVDLVARAERLPVRDGSVRAIYGMNVFHHFARPREFFRELVRVLAPGGGAVLIEPYYGPVARGLFRNLHASERFDPDVADWDSTAASGPMSNANQALSYVVFVRDRRRFEQEFPQLELVLDRPHTQLSYLLSGGVNFRQLVPDRAVPAVEWVERALRPLDRWLAIQHTVVLRKKKG